MRYLAEPAKPLASRSIRSSHGLLALLALAVAVVAPTRVAGAEMTEATVKKVKKATVLLDVPVADGRQNGTGFLVRRDAARKTGYLLTNAHVVDAAMRGSAQRKVKAIFNPGTAEAREASGEVIAEDVHNDLALIRVEDAALPEPLGLDRDAALKETMPVFAVGFPLADMLAVGERRPAVTLTAGSVSSLRVDDFGVLSVIQLDCDINPGNSGGPVVDPAGDLVGIAVAKVVGTRIGFVIPPHCASALFLGTVGPADLRVADSGPGLVRFTCEADQIDPFKRVQSAVLIAARKDRQSATPMKPDANGRRRPLPGAVEIVKLKESTGDGRYSGTFDLKSKPGEQVTYLFQMKVTRLDGVANYESPQERTVGFPETVPGDSGATQSVTWVPLVPGKDAPAPAKSDRKCVKEQQSVDGATIRVLDIPARGVVGDVVLSADGQAVFCLEKNGRLHRISIPDCVETATLETGRDAACLTVSSMGLVLAMASSPYEIWLVDEASLQVRRRYRTSLFEWLAGSRATPFVYGNSRHCREKLWAVDLRSGRVAAELTAAAVNEHRQRSVRRHADSVLLNLFTYPTLSADAKYLFCYSFECLCRFRTEGAQLTWEEIGPRLQMAPRIDTDADGLYVAVPGGAKTGTVSDHPQITGSYVYRTGNLQAPVLALPSDKYVQAVAFDGAAKLVYVGASNVLEVRTPQDNSVRRYTYGTYAERARQIVPSRKGRRLLLLSDDRLFWIELPEG